MVDMLVLARARRFTGFIESTLGWYLRETRCQRGIPMETATWVGTANSRLEWCLHVSNYTATCPPTAADDQ